jgi:hypothetical protein
MIQGNHAMVPQAAGCDVTFLFNITLTALKTLKHVYVLCLL